MHKLKLKLSKYGTVVLMKQGYTFTVFITGRGLSNLNKVLEMQKLITDHAKEYPSVEALSNDETYFLLVLKPKAT